MVKYEERERDATAPFHRSKYFFFSFFLLFFGKFVCVCSRFYLVGFLFCFFFYSSRLVV